MFYGVHVLRIMKNPPRNLWQKSCSNQSELINTFGTPMWKFSSWFVRHAAVLHLSKSWSLPEPTNKDIHVCKIFPRQHVEYTIIFVSPSHVKGGLHNFCHCLMSNLCENCADVPKQLKCKMKSVGRRPRHSGVEIFILTCQACNSLALIESMFIARADQHGHPCMQNFPKATRWIYHKFYITFSRQRWTA